MIPPKSDPIWKEIVDNTEDLMISALPTKMLFMRVKMLRRSGTSKSLSEAIDAAYDFFSKNEDAVKEDVAVVFAKKRV